MILIKIAMVGATIALLMAVARDQHWAQRAGVVGRCAATPPARSSPGGSWYVCEQGILNGFPNLEEDACQSVGIVQHREVWSCIKPLESLPGS